MSNDLMMLLLAIRDGSFSGYNFVFERVVPLILTTYLVRLNVDVAVQTVITFILSVIKRVLLSRALVSRFFAGDDTDGERTCEYECKWDDTLFNYIETECADDPNLVLSHPYGSKRRLVTRGPLVLGNVRLEIAVSEERAGVARVKIFYRKQADVEHLLMSGRATSTPVEGPAIVSRQVLHRQMVSSTSLARTEFYRTAYSLQYACISGHTRRLLNTFIHEHMIKSLIPNFKTQSYTIFTGLPGRGKSAAISALAQKFSYNITHLPNYFSRVRDVVETLQNRTKEILVIDDMQKSSFWYHMLCNNAAESLKIMAAAREAELVAKKDSQSLNQQNFAATPNVSTARDPEPEGDTFIESLEPYDYLLSALDGPKTCGEKIIVITTNITKSELEMDIPSAMRRPGRFHQIIEFSDMSAEDCAHYVETVVKCVIERPFDTSALVKRSFETQDSLISPANFASALSTYLAEATL